ncbi:MAG: hypothetical protein ACFFCE_01705 [Promethearchaeota archaeon]
MLTQDDIKIIKKLVREAIKEYVIDTCFENDNPKKQPKKTSSRKTNTYIHNGKPKPTIKITGMITKETEKALFIKFDEKEAWIPKSTVKSWKPTKEQNQSLEIETWVLKKNEILTETAMIN